MAIADELTKLENNRANIVAAINNKGGELAENAGLAACPEAISQLSSAGGTTLWTGHVDEAGLRYIGWDDTDIALIKSAICWNEEDDYIFKVPEANRKLWDEVEKVEVGGRLYATQNSVLALFKKNDINFRYLPPIKFTNPYGCFNDYYNLWATPIIDFSNTLSNYNQFKGCRAMFHFAEKNSGSPMSGLEMLYSYYSFSDVVDNQFDIKGVVKSNNSFGNCVYSKICNPIINRHITSSTRSSIMWSYKINLTIDDGCTGLQTVLGIKNCIELNIMNDAKLNMIKSASDMPTSQSNCIGMFCGSIYKNVKGILDMMLRGIPNYTADSYPMYFENGSTVTDDAAGTLQSLVEQCQAMGWAIYNLTINPYT